tara:strand:- start:1650 stop:1994 length:345 start_codon:yes stop_codon:yes gene_type:complete
MEITYTSNNGRLTLHASGNAREVFEQLAEFDEVFNQSTCAATGSDNVSFRVRQVEGNKYYEIVANETGHKLSFGQTREGQKLFPRRKDKDGNWLADKGWVKWEGKPSTTATSVL